MTHIITSLCLRDNGCMEEYPMELITQPGDSMKSSQSAGVPAMPDSEKQTPSPWIEKYELGSGKNKINVRIFKEPDPEPVSLEPHKEVHKKPVETLVLRLKKDFTATPTRPRPLIPSGHSN